MTNHKPGALNIMNHPNRIRAKSPASNPDKEVIRSARINAGLTQTKAAEIIYSGIRAWQKWESGEHKMHPGLFELFLKKTGQID